MAKQFICKLAEVASGHSRTFVVAGRKIFVANIGGKPKAYVNFCPHMGGSLYYDGRNIKCNWHGALFDPATGVAKTAPALEGASLEGIELMVEGEDLYYEDAKKERSPWADDFS
jgi:nitrite reductase/ring-hydroxylating ferredoxin subunit